MDTTNAHHDTSEDAEAPDTHVQTADNTQARETASVPADSSPTEDSPAATVVAEPATASSTTEPSPWHARLHSPAAGWATTAIATIVAALIRLPGLNNVRTLVFDETYYVKDAWSLLTLGYEGTWPNNYDASFVAGNVSGLSAAGGYPVHPPTGKWIIAIGMKIFGQTDPVGWRITTAICGIITVFLLCRITQNLFRSPALTLLAGLFLATDGIAIVMSRTSILDGFLAMFALAAFFCFVKDQQMSRPMLAHRLTAWDGIGAPRGGWHDLGEFLRGATDAASWSAPMPADAPGCSLPASCAASPPRSSGPESTSWRASAYSSQFARSPTAGDSGTPPPSGALSSPTSGGHSS